MTMADREFAQRSERIEDLVNYLQNAGDPSTRAVASELLRNVMVLHGVAIERILDEVVGMREAGQVLDAMAKDELVSGVLLLHNLHPMTQEDRVRSAIDKVRPCLQSDGGDVELISIDGGVVSVRLHGPFGSYAASVERMKRTVEEALYNMAPEISSVIADYIPMRAHSSVGMLRAS